MLYTEAEALFVCKEVLSSNALVEGVQRAVHAAAGDGAAGVIVVAASAAGDAQAPLA